MMRSICALFLVISAALVVVPAQAQQPQKPNILVIWGDDIGVHNVSAYTHAIMGYRTPNIDRLAQEGRAVHRRLRPAVVHRRARLVHSRPEPVPHRPADHRHAGLGARHPRLGADHRRPAQGAGLHHRPVRQEPSRRPRQAPADGARLRRVLRQPLPPQRRGGAGDLLLSEGSGVPEEVRAARRSAHLCQRYHQRYRAADREAHGNHRPGNLYVARRQFLDSAVSAKKPFFVWFNTTRMHVWTHLEQGVPGQDRHRPLSGRHGRARRHGRRAAEETRRPEDRRRHHRHLFHRQRRRNGVVAGRRHHAVLRREGDHLGRRLPRAPAGALAGRGEAGHYGQRHHLPGRLAAHPAGRRRRPRRQGEAGAGLPGQRQGLAGSSSTATTSCRS